MFGKGAMKTERIFILMKSFPTKTRCWNGSHFPVSKDHLDQSRHGSIIDLLLPARVYSPRYLTVYLRLPVPQSDPDE